MTHFVKYNNVLNVKHERQNNVNIYKTRIRHCFVLFFFFNNFNKLCLCTIFEVSSKIRQWRCEKINVPPENSNNLNMIGYTQVLFYKNNYINLNNNNDQLNKKSRM